MGAPISFIWLAVFDKDGCPHPPEHPTVSRAINKLNGRLLLLVHFNFEQVFLTIKFKMPAFFSGLFLWNICKCTVWKALIVRKVNYLIMGLYALWYI